HTVGKQQTQKIERKHLTFRTRLKRLTRQTWPRHTCHLWGLRTTGFGKEIFATLDLKPFIFQPCNNFETSKYALKTRQPYFPTSGKEVVARFGQGRPSVFRVLFLCMTWSLAYSSTAMSLDMLCKSSIN